jgi:hypothetical protein
MKRKKIIILLHEYVFIIYPFCLVGTFIHFIIYGDHSPLYKFQFEDLIVNSNSILIKAGILSTIFIIYEILSGKSFFFRE